MADGTVSFAEGLGSKALDSNEMRRQQKNARYSPPKSTHKPFDLCPSPTTYLKRTSPSRKLQQVFEEELMKEVEGQQQLYSENPKFSLDREFPSLSKVETKRGSSIRESIPPVSSSGFGPHSPKSYADPSPSRTHQQAFFEQGLILEAEKRAAVQLQGQSHEVSSSNLNPKTLFNVRGMPYLEGDPSMGYSEADTKHTQPQNLPQHVSTKPRLNQNIPKAKPKNWASLLQSQSPSMDMKLDFQPDLFKGKEAQVEIDIELTDVGRWNRYLVGHFLDGKMPYALVVSTARYQWKDLFVAVKPDVAGCYLFEFKDEQAKQQILDGGPYFFSQKYLVLKDWHRMMQPVKEQPSHIPAWVKLHNLPLELWNQECLSRIASTIGKPLHVDHATAKTSKQPGLLQTKSTSARICIEISAEHELPVDVRITVGGNSVVVPIEYQVLPLLCKHCQVFGHATAQCSKKPPPDPSQPTQEWNLVGNGKPTSLPHSESIGALNTSKSAIVSPQAEVLADSEEELENVLVGIVSSTHESLDQTHNQVPNQQLQALGSSEQQLVLVLPVSSEQEAHSLPQQMTPSELQLEEVNDSGEHLNPSSQQFTTVSISVAKKAAKIAAKLRIQEPLDPGALSARNLQTGAPPWLDRLGGIRALQKALLIIQGSNFLYLFCLVVVVC